MNAPAPIPRPHVNPVPRFSASVVVLRDGAAGLEVLMLRRAERANDQNSGAAVFPGGLLDAQDSLHHALCSGLDDTQASRRLGLNANGLDYWMAAVRECFEESGLLFARGADDQPAHLDDLPAEERRALRHSLHAGDLDLAALCARFGLTLDVGALTYLSHWITPPGRPKRFDTRFFVAVAPAPQQAVADETETTELMWLTPQQALSPERGLKLLNVTEVTLKQLAGFGHTADVIAHAAAQPLAPAIRPVVGAGERGPVVVMPGEWPYDEIARLDPEGRGHVAVDLKPGRAVRLSERVIRITADNGSVMTGPGTNAYFVGSGTQWALVDPGPDDATHVKSLLEQAAQLPGPLQWILCTHTHKDHSPAAAALHRATGAPRAGRVAAHPEWQDTGFAPERVLAHGDRINLGPDCTLRVVHTPGHASNHLCFLLEQERLLFTGDHLMQGSTVVINPPDGDMAAYLASLEALLQEDLDHLAPGHGFLIAQPHAVVKKTIAHRLGREAKVVDALRAGGPAALDALVTRVYADVPERLHAVARRSLQAHLLKLQGEARTVKEGEVWRLA
ncbi:Zn-dependent hydrolase, glyoxylase [Burkholderiales bacterium JOSHI_001]|nr:Zn-dependent hydrolase, glyoxylase [Burkholderiales bacterium JOSHI_001]